jgi:hypothetical protein
MDFLVELIGAEEMQRIIAHGEDEEIRHVTTVTGFPRPEILL